VPRRRSPQTAPAPSPLRARPMTRAFTIRGCPSPQSPSRSTTPTQVRRQRSPATTLRHCSCATSSSSSPQPPAHTLSAASPWSCLMAKPPRGPLRARAEGKSTLRRRALIGPSGEEVPAEEEQLPPLEPLPDGAEGGVAVVYVKAGSEHRALLYLLQKVRQGWVAGAAMAGTARCAPHPCPHARAALRSACGDAARAAEGPAGVRDQAWCRARAVRVVSSRTCRVEPYVSSRTCRVEPYVSSRTCRVELYVSSRTCRARAVRCRCARQVNRMYGLDDLPPEVPPEIAAFHYQLLCAPRGGGARSRCHSRCHSRPADVLSCRALTARLRGRRARGWRRGHGLFVVDAAGHRRRLCAAPHSGRRSKQKPKRLEQRRSERKRTQTEFFAATETLGGTDRDPRSERRAREAAVASAYEPLRGLKQLRGGGGRVWVGTNDSPALDGFAPSRASRQQFLDIVQQF
jgi:hypothetical protein